MKKRLLILFLIVLIIGISITAIFSIKIMENLYIDGLENRLISNCKTVSNMFIKEYNSQNLNYDELAKEFANTYNVRVTIVLEKGKVIGESDTDSKTMDDHSNRTEIMEASLGKIGKATRYSSTEHMDRLYIALPVEYISIPKTIVRLSVPLSEVLNIRRHFSIYILYSVLIGFTISFIIAYKFIRDITGSLKQIISVSSQIANGEYNKRIIFKSKDEMGQLTDTFNNMAEKLEVNINELSDKKNKLESILKSMENGVIAVDNVGKIMMANTSALDLFGFRGNVIGKQVLDVFRNIDFEDIIFEHNDINRELNINFPDKKTLKVKATPIKDLYGSGEKSGIVVVIQDITELKHLEQIRTEFVANVSHELKTPLTSIKGFAETLRTGQVNDDKIKEKFLDIINAEADRLTRLINDLLSLSELENMRQNVLLEKININNEIEEIEDMMSNLANLKNIKLTFNKFEGLPYIMGNHDKVKQLLINLVDNGIKYTPQGGYVSVKSYLYETNVLIEVSDTGIGIPKESITRIFERFYRVDKGRSRSLGGTGLGLAIVKHIVSLMNGKIKVESELGKGTKFTISIPKVESKE